MKVNRVKKGGKRLRIFGAVRNVAVLISVFATAIIVYIYLSSHPIKPVFPIGHIAFFGNRHLTDDEVKALSGIHPGVSLAAISGKNVGRQLLKSPWVRSVSVRREFPDTLSIVIKETEPFALLDMNEHLFLIDEKGRLLEELKDDSVPFLPVITCDPFREKEGFSEAINLVRLMNNKGLSSERDCIEITAHKPQELSVTIDGTVVKVGAGGYEEKIERLIHLEEKIKSMGIFVDYIDLRFSDKAIVKPITDKAVN
jgi:cell division protein FtsQ